MPKRAEKREGKSGLVENILMTFTLFDFDTCTKDQHYAESSHREHRGGRCCMPKCGPSNRRQPRFGPANILDTLHCNRHLLATREQSSGTDL